MKIETWDVGSRVLR